MAEMIDDRSGKHEQSKTDRDRHKRYANVAPANTSDMEEIQGSSIYAKRNCAQRHGDGEIKHDVASRHPAVLMAGRGDLDLDERGINAVLAGDLRRLRVNGMPPERPYPSKT